MLHDDPRFAQLVLLNQQLSQIDCSDVYYRDELLERINSLSMELYLEYGDDSLLDITE